MPHRRAATTSATWRRGWLSRTGGSSQISSITRPTSGFMRRRPGSRYSHRRTAASEHSLRVLVREGRSAELGDVSRLPSPVFALSSPTRSSLDWRRRLRELGLRVDREVLVRLGDLEGLFQLPIADEAQG